MTFSAKDLRFKISELFDILDKGKEVIITFRGKAKAKIVPFNSKNNNKKEHQLFGIWKDKNIDVDNFVRDLRKSRNFDL